MSIEIANIKKSFGRTQVLNDISLDIPSGQMVALLGPSGSGKTTLLRIIAGLEHQTSGHIRFHGTDVSRLHARDRKVGFVFQHYALFRHMTVFDNIAFGLTVLPRRERPNAAAIKAKVTKLLEMVQLAHLADRYPAQLSGGQKQRVGIARAIVSNPSVLLSDEATSALDPETVKSILQLLKDINKKMGITIIMITHQMEVIKEIAEQVAVIEKGKIIEQGSVVDLFTNPQTETLKKFVGSVMSSDVPEQLSHMNISKVKQKDSDQTIVSLKFRGDVANEPIIANLIRKYNLDVSILYGSIDYIQNVSFGRLIIMINGHEEDMKKALGHLQSLPITSEVIGYVPSDN